MKNSGLNNKGADHELPSVRFSDSTPRIPIIGCKIPRRPFSLAPPIQQAGAKCRKPAPGASATLYLLQHHRGFRLSRKISARRDGPLQVLSRHFLVAPLVVCRAQVILENGHLRG